MDPALIPERKDSKPTTDAERLVWAHAFWARLNHPLEKFIPTQANDVANQVLGHARASGVVDAMAETLKSRAK